MVEPQKCYKITYGAIAAYQEVNGRGVILLGQTKLVHSPNDAPVDYPSKVVEELLRRFRFVFGHPINQREAAIAKLEDVEVWA